VAKHHIPLAFREADPMMVNHGTATTAHHGTTLAMTLAMQSGAKLEGFHARVAASPSTLADGKTGAREIGGGGLSFGKLARDEARAKLVDRQPRSPSYLAVHHFFLSKTRHFAEA
jgi:hypothetical protein